MYISNIVSMKEVKSQTTHTRGFEYSDYDSLMTCKAERANLGVVKQTELSERNRNLAFQTYVSHARQ